MSHKQDASRQWRLVGQFSIQGAAERQNLLLVAHAEQFQLLLLDLLRLRGGNGLQESLHAIEGAVGVIGGDRFLVRLFVAPTAQFADDAALGLVQHPVEDIVPLLPEDAEQQGGIHVRHAIFRPPQIGLPVGGDFGEAVFAMGRLEFAPNEGTQVRLESTSPLPTRSALVSAIFSTPSKKILSREETQKTHNKEHK